MLNRVRLGVNIDHVATIRNARGGRHPDPVRAAILAANAGADGITAHLREDRRHISDNDIARLAAEIDLPLNLEMAATQEMLEIALAHRPHACCLVPEKREEKTTEGGLDAARLENALRTYVRTLQDSNIRVSLFIDPAQEQVEAAKRIGAKAVELHTGAYAEKFQVASRKLQESAEILATYNLQLATAAKQASQLGLEVHAGHGLNYDNVGPIAAIPEIVELNIGHFLIGEAVFVGLKEAIEKMRSIIKEARQ